MTFYTFARDNTSKDIPGPTKYFVPEDFGTAPKLKIRERIPEKNDEKKFDFPSPVSTLSKKGINIGPKEVPDKKRANTSLENYDHRYIFPSTVGEGPAFTIQSRTEEKIDTTPGPCEYDVDDKMVRKSVPAYTCGCGKRFDYFVDNVLVPPGQYSLPTTMGTARSVQLGKPGKKPFVHKQHPGPIYNIPSTIGANCPKYSFSRAPRSRKIEITPGPGNYQTIDSLIDPHKYGFKMQPIKKVVKANETYPRLYDTSVGLNKNGVTIGSRQETKYDNGIPGPKYSIESDFGKKSKSIGQKREQLNTGNETPGPGTYNIRNDEKPQQSIALPGPVNRDIINKSYAKTIPGPAEYDVKFVNYSKKITIGNKTSSPVYAQDTNAPYYTTKSSLSGPSFTIGSKF